MAKLLYKLEISGTIEVLAGLHIGGSDVDLNIGGIDSEVAKNKTSGKPYIPGSSLSGKIRSLIAKAQGYKYLNYNAAEKDGDYQSRNWDRDYLALLFNGIGFNADFKIIHNRPKDDSNNDVIINGNAVTLSPHTRLLVRDDYMLDPNVLIENILEDKAENLINRNTGEATPRHIERVVTGTQFQLKMILDIYENDNVQMLLETLNLGINLLNNDYLGGMGSRGSGEVKILVENIEKLEFSGGNINRSIYTDYLLN